MRRQNISSNYGKLCRSLLYNFSYDIAVDVNSFIPFHEIQLAERIASMTTFQTTTYVVAVEFIKLFC